MSSYWCIYICKLNYNSRRHRNSSSPSNNKIIIICAPFADCMIETNNAQKDNTKDIDVVMPMYNLIEYSDNYSTTSESLWQYDRDEPALDNNDAIVDFPSDNNTVLLLNLKQK